MLPLLKQQPQFMATDFYNPADVRIVMNVSEPCHLSNPFDGERFVFLQSRFGGHLPLVCTNLFRFSGNRHT